MKTKIVWIASLIVLGGTLILVFSLSFAESPLDDPCNESWSALSEAEREACIKQAGGLINMKATDDALLWETAQARPTMAPMAGLATQVAITAATGTPTDTPTLPPDSGGIPPKEQIIRKVLPEERAGSPFSFRYYFSVWQIGAIPANNDEVLALYAVTPQEQCAVATTTGTRGSSFNQLEAYEQEWICPENSGAIQITDVTGPTGIIMFTDQSGRTGTFDLATEEWTLAGQPWLTTVTVTPQP